jgi:hypothetical protein
VKTIKYICRSLVEIFSAHFETLIICLCERNCLKIFSAVPQGESVVNKLIASENASQLQIYGVLEFDAKQLNGKRIQTQCPAGYELYEDIICGTIFHG